MTANAGVSRPASTVWTADRDEALRLLHGTMPIPAIAVQMGVTRGSIRSRVSKLGLRKRFDSWTDAEVAVVRERYESATHDEDLKLDELAAQLGRSKQTICVQARKMGLTDYARPWLHNKKGPKQPKYATIEESRAAVGRATRERFASGLHPRGMLGKRHTDSVKAALGQSSRAWWASLSPAQKDKQVADMLKAAIAKNGRIGPVTPNRGATWKAGWREIGGRMIYFRSRWEANYARYLEWLKERGDILEWEYEPETFWFENIKRGVRSYLPDFRVHELNGSKPVHEVKGWMDARSKTTLKRMAKYHPSETIILIREKEYRALSRLSALIGGWE